MRDRKLFAFALLLSLFAFAASASAQDAEEAPPLIDELSNPRGLFYDAEGNLWVTEGGKLGTDTASTALGPVRFGGTSRVMMVEAGDDDAELVLGGLPSAQAFDDVVGVNSVYVDEDSIWLAIGLGPVANPLSEGLLELDRSTLRIKQFVDLHAYEDANNPDGDVVAANPMDMVADASGKLWIIDASGNDLLTWTPDEGIQLIHTWTDLPVPTALDLDAEGNIYVGFLTAFPYDPGTSKVEKWSPAGELLETYGGLTAVTDVLVAADGTVYAVQFGSGYGDTGFIPGSGSVVTVSADGITPVAEGLNYPYRLAQAPDGTIALIVNSAFTGTGAGKVITLVPAA